MLTLALIEQAAAFLEPRLRRTPLEPSPALSELTGVPCYLKLEALQLTGSFKIRGAWFCLSRLTADERRAGVASCSAGNHGKAVAHAARELGISARIYLPANVDPAKLAGIERCGATVIVSHSTSYDETEAWAREHAAHDGLPFVSAFEDDAVIAGNGGTLAREILQQLPEARSFVIPVSGGGLGAGLSFWVEQHHPEATVIACQHAGSPSLARSFERGEAVTSLPGIETLAGGLEGGVGARNFELMRSRIAHVALVDEQALYRATAWMLEQHQYLIEPSAAATVAAALERALCPLCGPAVFVVSGRNLGLSNLRKILDDIA